MFHTDRLVLLRSALRFEAVERGRQRQRCETEIYHGGLL
jgi:hypothetical protein